MDREVKLFLVEQEVEFSKVPDILYNFNVDDLTSPAAVKNTFSKTITIPATPNNNKIFGSFYKNDFLVTSNIAGYGIDFDPRKRMPFIITINGDIYETGYARLDKVKQKVSEYEYEISLFGGLGDFFYQLEYGDEAGKRKMSSLKFVKQNKQEIDIDVTINANNLYEAWITDIDDNSKYSIINFAPCYDGIPSNFSADKVLVNYSGITSDVAKLGYSAITSGGTTYKTYNNYYLAELPKEYTQAEMREYRSWMQRPVFRIKKGIQAICDPENNGGYTVVLDPDFFYSGNPYYESTWVTLPLLNEIKSSDFSTFDDYSVHTFSRAVVVSQNQNQYSIGLSFSPSISANAGKLQFNLQLLASSQTQTVDAQVLYTSANVENVSGADSSNRNFCGYMFQIRAYAGEDPTSSVIGTSEAVMCTSQVGNGDFLRFEETMGPSYISSSVKYSLGYFNLIDAGKKVYEWSEPFTLAIDVPPGAKSYAIVYWPVANLTTGTSGISGEPYTTYGNRRRKGYTATALTEMTSANTATVELNTTLNTPMNSGYTTSFSGDTFAYLAEGRTMGYTGAYITKNMFLDTDYSPCDFLLSYAKLFGLYFVKNPHSKEINILTRKNFFNRSGATDISNFIDRSSVEIKPLAFDAKWYNWGLEAAESQYENLYDNAYGKKYGDNDENTGYEFNTETKNVLDGNIFRSAIEALERSNQFYTIGPDDWSRPWMHNSYKYTLYNPNDAEDTIEISIPKSTTVNRTNLQLGYNFYDIFSKPVFHNEQNSPTDGKNVLLINNSMVQVGGFNSSDLKAYITDDVPEMGVLNSNEACWLYTQGGRLQNPVVYGFDGNVIARRFRYLPHYSRLVVSAETVLYALDFGEPEKMYVPGIEMTSAATMYNLFWGDYMSEIFNPNSRVMKCKMLITETPSVEWLRRFYYFDNVIWRMSSIKDWNITSDNLTEVEFVKVMNINKYTSSDVYYEPE